MQLRFVNYFVVLCEELHFRRAASRLAITQPPLSAAIKSLESDLGVQLLIRNNKQVQLTPAGEAFLIEANQILDRVARARSVVRAVEHGEQGRLDIGTASSLLYREVPRILANFRREMPGIEVVLQEVPSAEHLKSLVRGQVDAAFINGRNAGPRLKSMELSEDSYVLCVPVRHRLVGQRKVDLRELADEHFVMFSRSAGAVHHDSVIAIFDEAGIHPRVFHRARSWLTIAAMVSQDGGVALVPGSLARAGLPGVRFIPLKGQATSAPALLVWNPLAMTPALQRFLQSAAATLAPRDAPARARRKLAARA